MAAQKGGDQDGDDMGAGEEQGAANLNIGVYSFFQAQRAAKKLKIFWKRHKDQKELDEAAEKKRIAEEKQKAADNEIKEKADW